MIKELTTEEELSGLLHVLLKRLPRVLKSGISYTKSIETLEQYQLRINSVKYFADYLEKVQESKVKKEVVYKKYKEFCFKNKITPKSETKFSQEMRKMKYEYKQLRNGGEAYRPYYWINLRLKE